MGRRGPLVTLICFVASGLVSQAGDLPRPSGGSASGPIESAAPGDCNDNGVPDDLETAVAFIDHTVDMPVNPNDEPLPTYAVTAVDIDGDGDADLVAAGRESAAWYENLDGAGSFGPPQVIVSEVYGLFAYQVEGADIDSDGDQDLVLASYRDLDWFENLDGAGTFGPRRAIPETSSTVPGFGLADFDLDGDLDVLVSTRGASISRDIRLVENIDGAGTFGNPRVINDSGSQFAFPRGADLNGDGDPDAVYDIFGRVVGWSENLGAGDAFGAIQVITDDRISHYQIDVADIDGDGDLDLLSGSDSETVWFSNTDGAGSFGAATPVGGGALSIAAADLDGDGDMDVVKSRVSDAPIEWHDNLDGAGGFGVPQAVSATAEMNWMVGVADLDGDGDRDVMAVTDDRIVWYENTSNDCDGNAIPDECEADCDANGIADACDPDCNDNGIADSCDIGAGASQDCDANGIPDECEPDCNENGILDVCDIAGAASDDCTGNGIPDECEPDCNLNEQPDSCDILAATSDDCTGDGTPDECEADCNATGVADSCDLLDGTSLDCNANAVPDDCDIGTGLYTDCDLDGTPDICDTAVEFSIQPVYAAASTVVSASVATDLDADGDLDLVAAYYDEGLLWFENTDGNGLFGAANVIHADDDPSRVFTADINGDGRPDVVSGLRDEWAWFENMGGGQFGVLQAIAAGNFALLPVDLDADGDLDLVSSFNEVLWFENLDGLGAFLAGQTLPGELYSFPHAVADLDEDGDPDILIATESGSLSWLRNLDGQGTFGEPRLVAPVRTYEGFAADLDGDSDLDVVASTWIADGVVWFENLDASLDFGPAQSIVVDVNQPSLSAPADLDGDGDLDVIVRGRDGSTLAWYENPQGSGSSWVQRDLPFIGNAGDELWFVNVGDLDGDGDKDLFTHDGTHQQLVWYRNGADDCNGNGLPDSCDLGEDCNGNEVLDECEADCNENGLPDDCDVAAGTSSDCNADQMPDECQPDCNENGTMDRCDIDSGSSEDSNANQIPDDCETDCNGNSVPDSTDILDGTSVDCNENGQPDDCDIDRLNSEDCNLNAIPDDCEPDCNANGVADSCDINSGMDPDCNVNGIPDSCDIRLEFATHAVSAGATGNTSRAIFVADLDGDQDPDILKANWENPIAWHENLDGRGTYGPANLISTEADFPRGVFAADLDGDGDLDALSVSFSDNDVAWYENLGAGVFGAKQIIFGNADGALAVHAADLDGDGDNDVISGSYRDDTVAWYENTDGAGSFGPPRVITSSANQVNNLDVVDIDADGDNDILATYFLRVAWLENTDGAGTFGPLNVLGNHGADVVSADIDGDGDPDVISAQSTTGTVGWNRNLLSSGSFDPLEIFADLFSVDVVAAGDLDGDGDNDVISDVADALQWHENLDGVGTFSEARPLAPDERYFDEIQVVDVDADGDMDVVTGGWSSGRVAWHENLGNDCNRNRVPDSCEPDCNANGITDACEIRAGLADDCNGNAVPDRCETTCQEACDSDGDGCIDEVDSDVENAFACGDSDGDGCDDCSNGSFDPATDGVNSDTDGVCDATDCLPQDNTVWRAPGPVQDLALTLDEEGNWLGWSPPQDPGGIYPHYDTLRSNSADDFVGAGHCLEFDDVDEQTQEVDGPQSGGVWYYLVRVENACTPGGGTLGAGSNGIPRSGIACP